MIIGYLITYMMGGWVYCAIWQKCQMDQLMSGTLDWNPANDCRARRAGSKKTGGQEAGDDGWCTIIYDESILKTIFLFLKGTNAFSPSPLSRKALPLTCIALSAFFFVCLTLFTQSL